MTHYCVANMPGAVPVTSTFALTNATLPYVLALADHGARGRDRRRSRPEARRQRRRRQGHAPGRRRGRRHAVYTRRGRAGRHRLAPGGEDPHMATSSKTQAPELHRRRVRRSGRRRHRGGDQPGHRRGDRRHAALDRGGRGPRRGGREARVRRLVDTTPPSERAARMLKLADAARGARRGDRGPRGQRTPASRAARCSRTRCRPMVDKLRFFAGRRTHAGGPGRGRVHGGPHLDHPARAGRRGGPDHAVELPADDGRLEDRPGAGRRLHDRPEAGRDHADHDGEARRAAPPRSARRASST